MGPQSTGAMPCVLEDSAGSGAAAKKIEMQSEGSGEDQKETDTTPKRQPSQMLVRELRVELKKRGLDTKGRKADLLQRLNKAIEDDALAVAEVWGVWAGSGSMNLNFEPDL